MRVSGRAVLLTLAILVSGCAWHTDALMVGPNTYEVSANAAPLRGGVTGAMGIALDKANQKCQSLGKQIVVIDRKTDHQPWPPNGIANVTFRCE